MKGGGRIRIRKARGKGVKWVKPEDCKWLCACGEMGFVDLGKDADNQFPCFVCYGKIRLKREKEK